MTVTDPAEENEEEVATSSFMSKKKKNSQPLEETRLEQSLE